MFKAPQKEKMIFFVCKTTPPPRSARCYAPTYEY